MTIEELLNKLIEKGRKPFGFKGEKTRIEIERDKYLDTQIFRLNLIIIEQHNRISGSLRNLTSKESGLWQFCCKNMLCVIRNPLEEDHRWQHIECILNKPDRVYYKNDIDRGYDYEYRLIECALKDESDLEKFLLDNIEI